MQFDWQAVAAPAIVLVAVAYLIRAIVMKWLRKAKPGESAGCGSCGSCPSGSASPAEPKLVQIGTQLQAPTSRTPSTATASSPNRPA